MGSLLCLGYYALIEYGPVSLPLLERYSKCHAVAYFTFELFFIAICSLVYKGLESSRQQQLVKKSQSAIEDIRIAKSDEPTVGDTDQIRWLEAAWKSQSSELYTSLIGCRIREVLSLLARNRSIAHLNEESKSASDRYADAQHDSYALVRIVTWAMPMLGFLGTVLGLSDTLGHMDAKALASGSQDAMNQLTSGLYVAFDTTAVGIVLTMVTMFVQFFVNKSELRLLSSIDAKTNELMGSCLVPAQPEKPDLTKVEASLKFIGDGILQSMEILVSRQAELWQDSMRVAEDRWLNVSNMSSMAIQEALSNAISHAMNSTLQPMEAHRERIAELQAAGVQAMEERLSGLQAMIAEQARQWAEQQQELLDQSRALADLIDRCDLVKSLESPLQETLHKLTDIDRFHDAAICLTEAVAVLGTQMERYGYLGRQQVRRREADNDQEGVSSNDTPVTLPMKRKAG
jgi:biopolymer transport protein ExbB/TolQ